jgi:hypothetical protein
MMNSAFIRIPTPIAWEVVLQAENKAERSHRARVQSRGLAQTLAFTLLRNPGTANGCPYWLLFSQYRHYLGPESSYTS